MPKDICSALGCKSLNFTLTKTLEAFLLEPVIERGGALLLIRFPLLWRHAGKRGIQRVAVQISVKLPRVEGTKPHVSGVRLAIDARHEFYLMALLLSATLIDTNCVSPQESVLIDESQGV